MPKDCVVRTVPWRSRFAGAFIHASDDATDHRSSPSPSNSGFWFVWSQPVPNMHRPKGHATRDKPSRTHPLISPFASILWSGSWRASETETEQLASHWPRHRTRSDKLCCDFMEQSGGVHCPEGVLTRQGERTQGTVRTLPPGVHSKHEHCCQGNGTNRLEQGVPGTQVPKPGSSRRTPASFQTGHGTFKIQLGIFMKCIQLIRVSQPIIRQYFLHSIKERITCSCFK